MPIDLNFEPSAEEDRVLPDLNQLSVIYDEEVDPALGENHGGKFHCFAYVILQY
jgi:hypothetical protein